MSGARKVDQPHVGLAVVVSGLMAVGLAAGLDFLGVMGRVDRLLVSVLARPGLSEPSDVVAPAMLWACAGALAFLLAAVMLNVPGTWKRLLIWGLTLALTLFWAPVLLLAAHKPEIGVAVVTVLWSGFCAMVYATNHVMPADRSERNQERKQDGAR